MPIKFSICSFRVPFTIPSSLICSLLGFLVVFPSFRITLFPPFDRSTQIHTLFTSLTSLKWFAVFNILIEFLLWLHSVSKEKFCHPVFCIVPSGQKHHTCWLHLWTVFLLLWPMCFCVHHFSSYSPSENQNFQHLLNILVCSFSMFLQYSALLPCACFHCHVLPVLYT